MSLGRGPTHEDLHRTTRAACEARLPEKSIFRLLAGESHRMFPDDAFADLFMDVGRNSISPRLVAVVMVLQRVCGMSDREAVDAFAYDLRWKYAVGVDFDHPSFSHTVLVDMRERLRRSSRPNRIFDAVLDIAKQAGLVGRKRVLDSTMLYDAVATQDTVTLIRSAIRALLKVAGTELEASLREALKRDDDYRGPGKPECDWDDEAAREALVDALARDAYAVLAVLDGMELAPAIREAATLVATVVGQDLEQREDGLFRIARRVAPDRVISTVDSDARHGHKSASQRADGYKGHVAIDPDSEIITATEVTAANVGDASAAEALLTDVLEPSSPTAGQTDAPAQSGAEPLSEDVRGEPAPGAESSTEGQRGERAAEVFGDASYGPAPLVERLENAGIEANVKVQPPPAPSGKYSQDAFAIDVKAGTVCCPNGVLVQLRVRKDGFAQADFGMHCATCPKREACTSSKTGRHVIVHPKHDVLHRARTRQRDAAFKRRYREVRPKVERKIAHMMRRRHGGRRARVRGTTRVRQDFALLGAATNVARLAALGVRSIGSGWTTFGANPA